MNEVICKEEVEVNATKPFMETITIYHPLKHFFTHDKQRVEFLRERFHDFPWYEIEEPTIRVLKRMKRNYNVSDEEFSEIIRKLEEK